MTKNLLTALSMLLLSYSFTFAAYKSITPATLHARLIACDTLLILDVREWSEYTADGHIAEPAGQLPLTPACMPWTSNMLRANHGKLPRDIDIIVQCRSGSRSALASAFLDSLGFTRVFNMTSGFNAWTFEKRTGGFGDGSGHWVRGTITRPDTIKHDSGSVIFYPASITGMDSLYCEIHFAFGKQPVPVDAPLSSIAGLFRVTVLNSFGLSLFSWDSLTMGNTTSILLVPRPKTGTSLAFLSPTGISAITGPGRWKSLPYDFQSPVFHCAGSVLYRWYNAEGLFNLAARQHTNVLSPITTSHRKNAFYDLRGRLITKTYCTGLVPVITSSGYYIFNTPHNHR